MPLPLTTAVRDALRAKEVAVGWLLDLYCDEETLRGWDKTISLTYGSDDYEPLGGKWRIEGEVRASADLVSEPLTIAFDGGPQLDDTAFVGRLLDSTWHQRAIRLRQVLLVPTSNNTQVVGGGFEWNGYMDKIDAPEGTSEASRVVLNCEGGLFRVLARNNRTVSDRDQRERNSDDGSFKNIAVKPFQDIPFGTTWTSIPGRRGPGAGPGRGGGGGGMPAYYEPSVTQPIDVPEYSTVQLPLDDI